MAWIPSHQEIRNHPKTRRAARRAGVSIPTLVGHLHLLWHWALDHAPDGDLGKFESDDIADAAMWDGDPDTFLKALIDCGPGDTPGFIDPDWVLHDWEEYGGAYGRRVAAARKAAKARWDSDGTTDAEQTQSEGNANASGDAEGSQSNRNAEESRGDDSTEDDSSETAAVDAAFDQFWSRYPRGKAGKPGGDGPRKPALKRWRRMTADERDAALIAVDHYRAHIEAPDGPYAAHAITWLNQDRWEQWATPPERKSNERVSSVHVAGEF